MRWRRRRRLGQNHDVSMTSTGLADSGTAFVGALLVATPLIDEPTFRRAVVLLLEHNEEGSLGVVLNDLSDLPADDVMPGWTGVLHRYVALGGPVQGDAGVAVASLVGDSGTSAPTGVRPLAQGWAVLDLNGEPAALAGSVDDAQLFLGYAGWGAGQLDEELAAGSWWVVASQPGDLRLGRVGPREATWSRVLRRQPTDLRLASTYPADPSHN